MKKYIGVGESPKVVVTRNLGKSLRFAYNEHERVQYTKLYTISIWYVSKMNTISDLKMDIPITTD